MSDFITTVLGEESSQKDRVTATEFKEGVTVYIGSFFVFSIFTGGVQVVISFLISLDSADALRSCMSYTFTKSPEAKAIMQEALEMDEIKFTSSSVWERREKPSEHWNDRN